MSATLRFFPWIRRGLVRALAEEADPNGVPLGALAGLPVVIEVDGTEVERTVQLRGPGSVVGLAPSQVVRCEPRNGTTDFEPNYFPSIELASAELPWMFTHAAPSGDRLIPWLVLVVVEADAATLGTAGSGPLPVLSVDDAASQLPDLRQAWAWAHVQANVDATDLEAAWAAAPEAFVSRLVCPRRLVAGTRYIACVVPSFENGRLAGLGKDPDADPIALAWGETTTEIQLPVYASWRFSTAAEPGDFEALIRRLEPVVLGGGVGVRDVDIGEPGSSRLPSGSEVLVGFEGALVSPSATPTSWESTHQATFQGELRTMLNEALTVADTALGTGEVYSALEHDPVVAPPAYGSLPAEVDAVPSPADPPTASEPRWISDANLDPTRRGVAGLGAEVVRRNQETFMSIAWDQAAGLREVNRVLNRSRLALEVGNRQKVKIDALHDGALMQVSRAVQGRIRGSTMTHSVRGQLATGPVPDGLVSAAYRRRLRSTTHLARATEADPGETTTLTSRLTAAFLADPETELDFAHLTLPHGLEVSVQSELGDAAGGLGMIDLESLIATWPPGPPPEQGEPPSTRALLDALAMDTIPNERNGVMLPNGPDPHAYAAYLSSLPGPSLQIDARESPVGSTAVWRSDAGLGPMPVASTNPSDAELPGVVRLLVDPAQLLSLRVRSMISPAEALGAEDVPASLTIAPMFLRPLYEYLVAIDPELLMPGVRGLVSNTVGLTRVNQSFVEAFLLGVNHELGREFLWREFPCDLRETWARTFWDSAGATDAEGNPLVDIEAIADWGSTALGEHGSSWVDSDQILVLVIKGELLRRYPRTSIYAVPGKWQDGARWEDEAEEHLYPTFVGSLSEDVVFMGFTFPSGVDLELDVIGSADPADGRAGWFFAFEQPPTEPRFGLDQGTEADAGTTPSLWKDLSWYHVLADAESTASHVDLDTMATSGALDQPYDDAGDNSGWTEAWAVDAAGMARITFQRPVRMLVHASEMLG